MLELSFARPNYFDQFSEFKEEFAVSALVTVARNPRCIKVAKEFYLENKEHIMCVTHGKDNPYMRYLKIINPKLWENYTTLATLKFYESLETHTSSDSAIMFKIMSKNNRELESIVKDNMRGNLNKVFQIQLSRIHKIINSSLGKNKDFSLSEFNKAVEDLIVLMHFIKTYIVSPFDIECNNHYFDIICNHIYNFVIYYRHALTFPETITEVVTSFKTKLTPEIKSVMKVLGINSLKGSHRFSQLEITYTTPKYTPQELKCALSGTSLSEILDFSEPNYTRLEQLRFNCLYPFKESPLENQSVSSVMVSSVIHGTYNTTVSESDDFTFTADELINVIGSAIVYASMHKLNVYQFFVYIYSTLRASLLIKAFTEELDNQLTPTIVTIDKGTSGLERTVAELKSKVAELTPKLELISNLEEENESLKLALKRTQEQLDEKSSNDKELLALRELVYKQSTDYFEEEDESKTIYDEAVEYLKSKEVILIGGYPAWVNKMKGVLPNIIYYDADSQNTGIASKISNTSGIIIFNTALNSHGMYNKVMPAIERNPNAELVMINSHGNIKRLIEFIYESVTNK